MYYCLTIGYYISDLISMPMYTYRGNRISVSAYDLSEDQIITVMGVNSGIDGIFHDSEALKPRFNLLAPLTVDRKRL